MRFIREKQYSMLLYVQTVLKKNKEELAEEVPILGELIDDILEAITTIGKIRYQPKMKVKQATVSKRISKSTLADAILKLMSGVSAYAHVKRDQDLEKSVRFSRTQLTRGKAEVIADRCKAVLDAANSIGSLRQYGIKPEHIQLAQGAYNKYVQNMRAPQTMKKKSAEENKEVDQLIKECLIALEKEIDPLMELACENNKTLLRSYKAARKVNITAGGRPSDREVRYLKSRKKKKTKA